eukprot:11140805-Alexandrium_andersonii.AAC.1
MLRWRGSWRQGGRDRGRARWRPRRQELVEAALELAHLRLEPRRHAALAGRPVRGPARAELAGRA